MTWQDCKAALKRFPFLCVFLCVFLFPSSLFFPPFCLHPIVMLSQDTNWESPVQNTEVPCRQPAEAADAGQHRLPRACHLSTLLGQCPGSACFSARPSSLPGPRLLPSNLCLQACVFFLGVSLFPIRLPAFGLQLPVEQAWDSTQPPSGSCLSLHFPSLSSGAALIQRHASEWLPTRVGTR